MAPRTPINGANAPARRVITLGLIMISLSLSLSATSAARACGDQGAPCEPDGNDVHPRDNLPQSSDDLEAARLQRIEDEAAIKQFMKESLLAPHLELSAEEADNYLHDLATPSHVEWIRDESAHGWSIWAEDASLKDRVEVVVQSFLQGRRRHAKLKSVLAAKAVA